MPDTGSAPLKLFVRTDGTRQGADLHSQQKAVAIKVRAIETDIEMQDMAVALSNRLSLDGGTQPTAPIPWNDQRITGLGAPTARTDAMRLDKVQDSTSVYAGTSTGTDTIAVTLSPAITAYVAGQRFHFIAGGTNTGAATLNANTVGAKNLRKGPAGSVALAAGDITAGGMYDVEYDGTNLQLLNPGLGRNISAFIGTLLDDATAGAALTTLGVSAYAQTILDDADASTAQTTLGISTFIKTLLDDTTAAAARTTLGAILTDAVFPGAIVAIIEDQKALGTDGGTFTLGADRVRTLNTLVYNRNTLVSLASNQFTLPAGNWEIIWSAPAYQVDEHQSFLFDITATAEVKRGTSERANNAGVGYNRSFGSARVSPAGSNVYEIRHRSSATTLNVGFGEATSFGTEVYTRVEIRAA